jgi:hypothetical protein
VRRTGGKGDIGMIRLDFPGYSGAQSLEPISWEEWFRKFDESKLALLYQESTARGQKSNFNKLIGRETAQMRAGGESKASRRHPERRTTNASGRATGRRSAKRQESKVAKSSRREEPGRKPKTPTRMTKRRAVASASGTARRRGSSQGRKKAA